MLKLQLSQLFKIAQNTGLSKSVFQTLLKKHATLPAKNGQLPFLKVLDDQKLYQTIAKTAAGFSGNYQHFVVLGIGGSALGARAIRDALENMFSNRQKNTAKDLYIADNIDPCLIKELEEVIDLKKTLFLVISKSGSTIETLSQYQYFSHKVRKAKLPLNKHFLFITDPQQGDLKEIADLEDIKLLPVCPEIGGRFSVLTAVGLTPCRLIKINTDKILNGARRMREVCLNKNPQKNPALQMAIIQHYLACHGKAINVLMPYSHKLSSLIDWYNQLLGESIGKQGVGITPVKAIGVTDQHSQIQLYNEGPHDKLIIFLEETAKKHQIPIPGSSKKLCFAELSELEKKGTESALTKNKRPNISIEIDQISEENLGALFIFFETSIAYLAELYGINAFDQPGVELGKKITKDLIAKKQC